MLDLGSNHPDFTYSNDRISAETALWLSAFTSIAIVIMIVATLLR